MSKTSIGLDKKASEKLAAKLNELLATYQVILYQRAWLSLEH